jgi:hypothetical protein
MSKETPFELKKIEKFGDKAMTRPAVAKHGRIGWWLVWNIVIKQYELREHVFFDPKVRPIDEFEWQTKIWLPVDEFRDRMQAMREWHDAYYAAHPAALTKKIRAKRGNGPLRVRCGRYWSE